MDNAPPDCGGCVTWICGSGGGPQGCLIGVGRRRENYSPHSVLPLENISDPLCRKNSAPETEDSRHKVKIKKSKTQTSKKGRHFLCSAPEIRNDVVQIGRASDDAVPSTPLQSAREIGDGVIRIGRSNAVSDSPL